MSYFDNLMSSIGGYLGNVLSGQVASQGLNSYFGQDTYDPNRSFAQNALDPRALANSANLAMSFSGGGLGTKGAKAASSAASDLAAPNIGQGSAGPLFDTSRLAEVPDVPQFQLPRDSYASPATKKGGGYGIPDKILALDNPDMWARYNDALNRGIPMGGLEWYNTTPLQQAFLEHGASPEDYRRFIDYVGASSPENAVPSNIRTASYLYSQDKQGLPFPNTYFGGKNWSIYPPEAKAQLWPKDASGNPIDNGLTGKQEAEIKAQYGFPSGYGGNSGALWLQNANNIRSGQGMSTLYNPKPPSFVQNLMGNQMPVTIDRHNMRLIAPGYGDSPGSMPYSYLEGLQQNAARNAGITPAQAQAATWLAGETGVKSNVMNEPFVSTVENKIREAAQRYGIAPQDMLKRFIAGASPL